MRWAPLCEDGSLDVEAADAVIHKGSRTGVVVIDGDFFAKAKDLETVEAVLGIIAGCYRLTFRGAVTEEAKARRLAELELDTEGRLRAPALSHHAACVLDKAGRTWAANQLFKAANYMPWCQRAAWPLANLDLSTIETKAA